MSQFDLYLTQNTAESGVEFTERLINLGKGALLSANASGVPTVLAAGSNTYMLVRDDGETTGLKWVPVAAGHTQNTDTGTTQQTFVIYSGSSTGKMELSVTTGDVNKKLTITNAALTADQTITFPNATGTVALTSQIPANPVQWVSAPANKTSNGTAGQAAYDGTYFYLCYSENKWARTALAANW